MRAGGCMRAFFRLLLVADENQESTPAENCCSPWPSPLAAAAVAYRKRLRTDAGARRATVRASSIFEERRGSAEEAQRLQRLQTLQTRLQTRLQTLAPMLPPLAPMPMPPLPPPPLVLVLAAGSIVAGMCVLFVASAATRHKTQPQDTP